MAGKAHSGAERRVARLNMPRDPAGSHASVRLPAVSQDQVARFLSERWGIEGELTALDGERDLNYRLRTGDRGDFVFKVCNAAEDAAMLDCQAEVFRRLESLSAHRFSRLVLSREGSSREWITADDGARHQCRLTEWVEGTLFANCDHRDPSLYRSLGRCMARVDRTLEGFSHPALERPLPWDLCRAPEVLDRYPLDVADSERKNLVAGFTALYRERVTPVAGSLRGAVIHNDANDGNVLVGVGPDGNQRVTGLIDFGDMLHGWLASEVAIACAYAMMGSEFPLDVAADIVSGYHEILPLHADELEVVFPLICMRLCLSVSIAAEQCRQAPDNEYLAVSVGPSWELMRTLAQVPANYAACLFRSRCGLPPVPRLESIRRWLNRQPDFADIVDTALNAETCMVLDAGVTSPHIEFGWRPHDAARMSREISRALENNGVSVGIGRYREYRLIYDSDDFVDFSGHRRTLHLGIDIFQPAGSPVYAPLDGSVHSRCNNSARFDYGGSVIIRHETDDGVGFFTLYGHLDPETTHHLLPGEPVKAGDRLGCMGEPAVNGHWPPHVHFQVITDLMGWEGTFVGVGSHVHRDVWCAICPDPDLLMRLPADLPGATLVPGSVDSATTDGGKNSDVVAGVPVRGAAQYVYDTTGRRFLDGRGGPAFLGHCHPAVNQAAIDQARLNPGPVPPNHPMVRECVTRLRRLVPDSIRHIVLTAGIAEACLLANGLGNDERVRNGSSPLRCRSWRVADGRSAGIGLDLPVLVPGTVPESSTGPETAQSDAGPGCVVLGEALANGFALGALLIDDALAPPPASPNESSSLHPMALAAAMTTLDIACTETFSRSVGVLGASLQNGYEELSDLAGGRLNYLRLGLHSMVRVDGWQPDDLSSHLAAGGVLTAVRGPWLVFAPPAVTTLVDLARFRETLAAALRRRS